MTYKRPRPSGPRPKIHQGAQHAMKQGVGGGHRPIPRPTRPSGPAGPMPARLVATPVPVGTLVPPMPQRVPVPVPVPVGPVGAVTMPVRPTPIMPVPVGNPGSFPLPVRSVVSRLPLPPHLMKLGMQQSVGALPSPQLIALLGMLAAQRGGR